MIGGPARRFRNDALKPQRLQIQLIDEGIDRLNRIVYNHVVVKELGQQNALRLGLTLRKALHQEP
jgi:hypothetical protein